MKILETLSG